MNQAELTFRAEGGAPTQEDRILDCLQSHVGQWVSMPHLWAVSGAFAVHSRCAGLRKRGVKIINKVERSPDGTRLSYYMLCQP